MKKFRRLACMAVTVVALLAPAAPASANEICDQVHGLPDTPDGYGWKAFVCP